MLFGKICNYFNRIESESSRNKMVELLSDCFSELKEKNEISEIVDLIQANEIKIGIGEKLVLKSISMYTGINVDNLKKILIKKGDVGSLAEETLNRKKQKTILDFTNISSSKKYELLDIYKTINEIKGISGAGSIGKKVSTISRILSEITPIEGKYFCRMLNGSIRIGISDKTIIKSLAKSFSEKSNEKELERLIEEKYNIFPYLGIISHHLNSYGIEEIMKIRLNNGTPIKMMLASRIPYDEILKNMNGKCIAEHKLDGERLQVHKKGKIVQLFSRGLTNISEQYPDICETVKKNVSAENVIIEGEVVAMDAMYEKMLPFQVLMRRKRKHDIKEKIEEIPVRFYVFDILLKEQDVLIEKPFYERRRILEETIRQDDYIKLVVSEMIHSTKKLLDFFKDSREKGNEGIICKDFHSKYEPNKRGKSWIKMKGIETTKMNETIDVIISGAYYGKGKNVGVYSTFLCSILNEKGEYEEFTRVGSGFSEDDLETLREELEKNKLEKIPEKTISNSKPDSWFEPKIVLEIKGDEISKSSKSSGYGLRFPVFCRVRNDKNPNQITTKEEIIELKKLEDEKWEK